MFLKIKALLRIQLVFLLLISLLTCKDKDAQPPEGWSSKITMAADIANIQYNSVQVTVTLNNSAGININDFGFCIDTINNLSKNVGNTYISGSTSLKKPTFIKNCDNLKGGKTYYIKAFFQLGNNYVFNQIQSFVTANISVGTVISNIQFNSAQVTIMLKNSAGLNINSYGFCIDTINNPIKDISNTYSSGSTSIKNAFFIKNCDNLNDAKTYYIKPYFQLGNDFIFDQIKSFATTKFVVPTILTSVDNGGDLVKSINIIGNITDDGSLPNTERGICWNTTRNPGVTYDSVITAGSGTGSFTVTLSNPVVKNYYYARAYAKNTRGTYYGNQVVIPPRGDTTAVPADTSSAYHVGYSVINIDGKGDESAWQTATEYNLTNYEPGSVASGAPDLAGSWKALWNDTGVYILVNVTDDILTREIDHLDWHAWEVDGIQLSFNPTGKRITAFADNYPLTKSSSMYFRPGNENDKFKVEVNLMGIFSPPLKNFNYAFYYTSTGYTLEVLINWYYIQPTEMTTLPKRWGFDVQIDDADNNKRDAILMWNAFLNQQWHDVNYFGYLQLK